MTDLRALAAGVLCAGFSGTRIEPEFEAELRTTPLAGLILFARNIESLAQTRALTNSIREILPDPVIAIDQEGGRVARLRDGVEQLPAMMALAATNDRKLAERAGAQLAFDLRRAGVNVDFAPVLDLALYKMNTVIGARSFGDDPAQVASLAAAFASGLRSQGIIPTFKHFPGHGSTAVDSHLDLPKIDLDEATFRSRDLVPFSTLLPEAEAIMTAHIIVRALDAVAPATLSRRILTDLLRSEIGFGGVCFTDCMEMDAIAKGVGSAEGAVQALIAGADCVLISHTFSIVRESIDRIVTSVQNGRLSQARLEEAFLRVQKLRLSLQPPLPLDAVAPQPGVGHEIGKRAVTLIRGDAHALRGESVVITFEGTTVEGVQGKHTDHASLAQDVPQIRLPLEPNAADVETALNELQGLRKRPIILMRRAHVYGKQRDAVQPLIEKFPDALLVSTREPFDAFDIAGARNVLCTYGDDAPSMSGLAEVIFGTEAPTGRYPLHGEAIAYA